MTKYPVNAVQSVVVVVISPVVRRAVHPARADRGPQAPGATARDGTVGATTCLRRTDDDEVLVAPSFGWIRTG